MGVEVNIPMRFPSQLRDNKVLITGASGFVESHL